MTTVRPRPIRDPNTAYICVDIEASGPVAGLFNMVSIANKERLLQLHPQRTAPAPDRVHNALADEDFQAEILIALLGE
ncbi:MAG: hypothetical protein ACI9U2_002368 [Bradymonadia bacterium]|jgi:hypothetical protein